MGVKLKKDIDLNVEIGLKEGQEWSAEKMEKIKALAKALHAKRTPAQILKNEIRAIQYQMEEYAEADEKQIAKPIPIDHFLQAYLKALDISFRKFAISIETNDANLRKYIYGERKFTPDLARKFGRFFHSSPVTWMKVHQLNDLIKLRTERVGKQYDKYDFMKVAHHGSVHQTEVYKGSAHKASAPVAKRSAEASKEVVVKAGRR